MDSTPPDSATSVSPPSPEPALDECSWANLTVVNPGQLTVGAVEPLDEPYFIDGKPGNGEGFESALVYAVAEGLGFRPTQVDWRVIGESDALDPAASRVDFMVGRIPVDDDIDVRQYSISYLQSAPLVSNPLEGVGEPSGALEGAADPSIVADQSSPVVAYALAFPPGDPLVTCVDGVLAELEADGDLQELSDTWLTDPVERVS